jgi:hypothetical protein
MEGDEGGGKVVVKSKPSTSHQVINNMAVHARTMHVLMAGLNNSCWLSNTVM